MLLELSQPRSVAETQSAVVAPLFSHLERLAIAIGIKDGVAARIRSRVRNLFFFFDDSKPTPLANPRLEALRAYAEHHRTSFPLAVPVTGLEKAGFTPLQIDEAQELIVAEAKTPSA